MKIDADIMDILDDNVVRQQAVSPTKDVRRAQVRFGLKTGNLSESMNSGIGSPRPDDFYAAIKQPVQRLLQFSLDSTSVRLNLPAKKVGAIVFYD
jgi:hypothetical protein